MRRYLESHGPAALALGTMNFGKRTPRAESLRIVDRAIDAGIGLVDTANVYVDGESERIVGEGTRGKDVLVATKVGLWRNEGLGRDTILRACTDSLRRLGRDHIDLYYLHAPDPKTPLVETLDALATLHRAGRFTHWGVSNFASWQILELQTLAPGFDLPPPAVAQQLYNVLIRQLDVEYFRFAAAHPIHTTVYNPLAGGLLAGAIQSGDVPRGSRFDRNPLYQRRYLRPAMFEAVATLQAIATREGRTLVDLAYAYVLGHPGVNSVLLGPATIDHLEAALHVPPIGDDLRAAIANVYLDLVGTDARYAR